MIYFDNAATTDVKPDWVINAVKNTLKYISFNPGRSGHAAAMRAAYLVSDTRTKCADFFNCANPELVAFTYNCTDALNMAIQGASEHGHVITTANEHNSVLRPLFELEKRRVIRLTVLAPDGEGRVTPKMILDNLRPDTYMVCVSHVSNVTGAASPIEDIGKITRPRDILFLVDAAQSAGHFPIDMARMNIDLLAVAGHKGLHGPQGVGALLMSEFAKLRPTRFGGTGTDSQNVYHPSAPPEAFEAGTLGTPMIAGLNGAIRWTAKHRDARNARIEQLSRLLLSELYKMKNVKTYTPRNSGSGIVSFNILNMPSADVCNILNGEYGICARGGLHCAPLIHRH
ncbi:MAG: aminotransferase class V-fold PLP-dependent enzyme, partial [Clostridiales bacterium]|nr:aminotransferase class V-fold PLP-dependent enzyme [Clostridiales bacterium]